MIKKLSVKHLLGIKQLSPNDIELILTTASQFKEVINRPIKKFLPYVTLPLQIYFLKIQLVQEFLLNLLNEDYLPTQSVFPPQVLQ